MGRGPGRRRDTAAEPGRSRDRGRGQVAATVPARTRDQIAGFFGDLPLVEPDLTDIWAWRPGTATVDTTSEFMRILGGVARKD
jgi:hypothetical protein